MAAMQGSASRQDTKGRGLKKTPASNQEEVTPRPSAKQVQKVKGPHPLESLLGDCLINAKGNIINPKVFSVDEGVIGVYFAAHWCPPCRSFCPHLMLLYDELRKRQDFFEVIFVSLDKKENSFRDYLSKIPWYAVPFTDGEKREEIAMFFGIKGIPVLVLLDAKTSEVIALNGRDIVFRDPRGALYPWRYLPDETFKASIASLNSTSLSPNKTASTNEPKRSTEGLKRSTVQGPAHSQQPDASVQARKTSRHQHSARKSSKNSIEND